MTFLKKIVTFVPVSVAQMVERRPEHHRVAAGDVWEAAVRCFSPRLLSLSNQ